MPLRARLRTLPLVAARFVVASLLGVLRAANAWLTIGCLIVVALLASMLVSGAGLGPPGPMQFVPVTGVSARLAAAAHLRKTKYIQKAIAMGNASLAFTAILARQFRDTSRYAPGTGQILIPALVASYADHSARSNP
jgi:hypothetical protein